MEEAKAGMEKELREKISKLEKELENANDLLSATKRKGRDDAGNSNMDSLRLSVVLCENTMLNFCRKCLNLNSSLVVFNN